MSKNSPQKGFTLLEVLVALAVVSSAFLVILSTFSRHITVFDDRQNQLKLILQAKENIYLYKSGKLKELKGARSGVEYEIRPETKEYNFVKVISTASSGKEEANMIEYVKKQ